MRTIATLAGCILVGLSLLHVYWACGGRSSVAVVPEREGKPLFMPSSLATWVVAMLLAGAAGSVLASAGLIAFGLPRRLATVATVCVGFAFLLRALGEFRYVGFFKRVRTTRFARLDTRVYSPLCLVVGVACLIVARG